MNKQNICERVIGNGSGERNGWAKADQVQRCWHRSLICRRDSPWSFLLCYGPLLLFIFLNLLFQTLFTILLKLFHLFLLGIFSKTEEWMEKSLVDGSIASFNQFHLLYKLHDSIFQVLPLVSTISLSLFTSSKSKKKLSKNQLTSIVSLFVVSLYCLIYPNSCILFVSIIKILRHVSKYPPVL